MDLPDSDRGDFSCRRAVNSSSFKCIFLKEHFNGLVQDCSNSSLLAMELLQSCTKPSNFMYLLSFFTVRFFSPQGSKMTVNQVMVCPLFYAESLPKLILAYWWTHRNKLQWNLNQNANVFSEGDAFRKFVYKMSAILFRLSNVLVVSMILLFVWNIRGSKWYLSCDHSSIEVQTVRYNIDCYSLKWKYHHSDEIFITDHTGSCQNDNFQGSQWWKFNQNDISNSVFSCVGVCTCVYISLVFFCWLFGTSAVCYCISCVRVTYILPCQ